MRQEIVQFISDHEHLFQSWVIMDDRNYTLLNHLESVRKPTVCASPVEIEAAVALYCVPIYLSTPNVSDSGYWWCNFSKRTLAVPQMNLIHIELAHQAGNHFDCTLDTTTMRPCIIPPLSLRKQDYHSWGNHSATEAMAGVKNWHSWVWLSKHVLRMAVPSVASFHDLGDQPNQPASFNLPKRKFGQFKPVFRSVQPAWFHKCPWLHYD